ncbi:MAG: class I SAM-dependent RNA methyltransferase [Methylococcales bacterium]|nr:class I SAM-dependent RNA methyltransferase [Methylococcales bacterium]
MKAKFSEITSFTWIVNSKVNSSFSELPFHAWEGTPYITEKLGGFEFRISPTSFFQTNSHQGEALYALVKKWAKEVLPEGKEKFDLIYDLYSGTGSIGIYVSELAKKIVGIEYVETAVKDAYRNLEINDLSHFSFHAGDMRKLLTPELAEKEGVPDLIITDPSRGGMEPKVIERILEMAPKHIIYVSCKPATQVRDIALMRERYRVLRVQPVDMFPHTAHVENVALLERI